MNPPFPLLTTPIDAADLLGGFQSSDASHASFFQRSALAQDRAGILRTHVLRPEDDEPPGGPNVLGYYSLSAGALAPTSRTGKTQLSPVIVMERFSVHAAMEGSGIAKHLLLDAFVRCAGIAAHIGVIGVLTNAPNQRAMTFCMDMDFVPMSTEPPCKLVIPLAKVRLAVRTAFSFP